MPAAIKPEATHEKTACWQHSQKTFQRTAIRQNQQAEGEPDCVLQGKPVPQVPDCAKEKRTAERRNHASPVALAPIAENPVLNNEKDSTK